MRTSWLCLSVVFVSSLSLVSAETGAFYLPENPEYTIMDSARDSVRFTVEKTLVPYKGHLACKSSFVDEQGDIMSWHDFGPLEGPGWAANAVGGAYELYCFGERFNDVPLKQKAVQLLDHVLEDGFINYDTGFITGYRHIETDAFCLNYQHKNNWFCPGSMAKIAFQLLLFSDYLDESRQQRMRSIAQKTAGWIKQNVGLAPNGWFPRRCHPSGKPYPLNCYGDGDILFEKSADGLFILQLYTALTQRGLTDYTDSIRAQTEVFIQAGGLFGSINHDTYDEHENVSYSVAFRVLREVAKLLKDDRIRDFAYERCLAGLDQFKMTDDRNGVQTKGLLFMERSWDTSYLWENAEAALAYFEAYADTHKRPFLLNGLTILRAAAKHHHGPHGFLSEGVDWNNHVGEQHHFNEEKYGDIRYTEPLLNNLHIVEPTLYVTSLVQVTTESFGKTETGQPITAYTLAHVNGMQARVINVGANLISLQVPDRDGKLDEVVLGSDNLEDYLSGRYSAVIGRFANRIGKASFVLDGKTVHVTKNAGQNHIHGGRKGFAKVFWQGEVVQYQGQPAVQFSYLSKDGEEGFPGNLQCRVTYSISADQELRIHYQATTDKPTVINLTNHAYFNLAGAGNGTVYDHVLQLDADFYTVSDRNLIPTGEIHSVKETPLDFTLARAIGSRIDELQQPRGYDHNYVLNGFDGRLRRVAEVFDPRTGRVLTLSTTEPGVQLYTANHLRNVKGRQGKLYPQHGAFCLETQHYPDSPNKTHFPSPVLRPGQTFDSVTVFAFSTR